MECYKRLSRIRFYRFMGEDTEQATCEHYDRLCSILTKCCNKQYPCSLCHDRNESHKLNPKYKQLRCRKCGTSQPISNRCTSCRISFANYFCGLCKIWCNSGDIYHCDFCKLCRIGPKSKFFHCFKCDACMDVRLKGNHNHVENTLKSDCPICAEYMFTSRKNIMFLACGHAIHLSCFESYIGRSLQCPVCMKSMIKPKKYYEKIEYVLKATENMRKEKEAWTCEISCYDCCTDTKAPYRYLFNKCRKCMSFNTRLNEIHKNENVK